MQYLAVDSAVLLSRDAAFDETINTAGYWICSGALKTTVSDCFPLCCKINISHMLTPSVPFISVCRATAVQSPPSSCSFRALLEEEENRLIRVGQSGAQRGQAAQGSPVTATPAARRVTFKCSESSEPEKQTG